MPCFKGIAVSIHANGAPLPEHGVQRQSRLSRISAYIPVPQPQVDPETNKPEPAKFAISITLLTPGLPIPYSTPKPTDDNPYPKPHFVGGLPTTPSEHNRSAGVVNPYIPMTNSENETIAAYIYFDGRAKEEVATLLRPGEETWVNSRWVQVPPLEGGGLAEREFLFREVGLERWLNGLDLQGSNVAERLEKRRQKFEKRRRRQRSNTGTPVFKNEEKASSSRDTLRYGADAGSPVEAVIDDISSDSDSDDEPPEATGQIKVLMFRVLASGEIKKGEYSPQFDAHDDDDDADPSNKSGANGGGMEADVEHTTSFAKPKTLDPKTISTQTVTGIDGPERPYASFTFFYRGERQLQKIGVLSSTKGGQAPSSSAKRRSGQLDFSHLGPLKTTGTVGFSAFRDQDTEAARRRKARKKSTGNVGTALNDSDDDEDESDGLGNMEDVDERDPAQKLQPVDAQSHGELAEGVNRIRLKRAHSGDPAPDTPSASASMPSNRDPATAEQAASSAGASTAPTTAAASEPPLQDSVFGSPIKKHRPSISGQGPDAAASRSATSALDAIVSQANAPASTWTSQSANERRTENVAEEEEEL
ncbi:hypothetical protein ACRALDRAFT_1074233 [Sodiomyces alcalophilus JCM 7366]|uniref:uncharacterized protein n=1 Tax=Sodiomyces alcalophilus JCM 7366 TaxID=591952 RepID=UPI0039B3E1C3